jgi:hypothetical protein
MVVTTRVRLDRVASSTKNAHLSSEVIVGDEIVAAEGYVLAVRILEDKSSYNTVEDLAGRMVSLRAGDVLAGTLGSRRALRGYAGVVPSHIAVGDTINVLNLGGILGRCTSVNPDIGAPFSAEVLGAVLTFPELGDRIGRPAHIRDHAVPPADRLESTVPVVYVAGTCMNAGKTVAATELVRGLARSGLRVAACKLTGVSLMRDVLSMTDAGAIAALTFNDVGVASTHPGVTVSTAKGIFNRLAAAKIIRLVKKLQLFGRMLAHARNDIKGLRVSRLGLILQMKIHHGGINADGIHLRKREAQFLEKIHSGHLVPDRVNGVMDDTHAVAVGKAHFDVCFCLHVNTPFIMDRQAL